MNEHDGLNRLDAEKKKELHDIRVAAAIQRVQMFFLSHITNVNHPEAIFNDAAAYDATELLRELWEEHLDFTDAIKPYGWTLKEFTLPYTRDIIGVQLVTPCGLVVLWKNPNAEEMVNRALEELPKRVIGSMGVVSQYAFLRTLAQGWVTIRRAFQHKKEF